MVFFLNDNKTSKDRLCNNFLKYFLKKRTRKAKRNKRIYGGRSDLKEDEELSVKKLRA